MLINSPERKKAIMRITSINNWLPRKYYVVIFGGKTDSYWSTQEGAERRYAELTNNAPIVVEYVLDK